VDTTNLKLQYRTWSVRLKVPRGLRPVVGKAELFRSLHTHDLREANRLKHRVLAELKDELARLAAAATLPKESVEFVVEAAKGQRALVKDGYPEAQAEAGLDAVVENYLDAMRRKRGIDSATGDPRLSEAEGRALSLAHRIFSGDDLTLLSEGISKYLREVRPRITKAAFAQKEKQLKAFAKWQGHDADVATITRKVTGRYVADVVQAADLAPKTKKDWIANLTAFGSWLELHGIIEANPWRNLTRAIRETTRGGVRKKKRPYTPVELTKLFKALKPGSPLLPLACLGAFSGMRLEELAGIKVEHISDDAMQVMEGKNENSVRYVPLHPAIRPMMRCLCATSSDGYVISGLLPGGADGKRSHHVSKRFGDFLRRNGFPKGEVDFHSFRRSFTQRCEHAEVPESTTQLLTGHARQSLTYGLYSPGPEFPTLQEAVTKVSYGKAVDALVEGLAQAARITTKSTRRHRRTSRGAGR
jgi:integrase